MLLHISQQFLCCHLHFVERVVTFCDHLIDLFFRQLETETRRKSIEITSNGLIQCLGFNSIERRQITVNYHLNATKGYYHIFYRRDCQEVVTICDHLCIIHSRNLCICFFLLCQIILSVELLCNNENMPDVLFLQ